MFCSSIILSKQGPLSQQKSPWGIPHTSLKYFINPLPTTIFLRFSSGVAETINKSYIPNNFFRDSSAPKISSPSIIFSSTKLEYFEIYFS